MCMLCAYIAALEASLSDLRREEITEELTDHRSTCKIFVSLLISVTGGCESTKWAANSIAIGVPFELDFNLDGNSAFSSSFSDDFMTAGSFRCDGISI